MNKNIKILLTFIFVLIFLNSYLLYEKRKANNLYSKCLLELNSNISDLEYALLELKSRMFSAYSNEDIDLSQNSYFKTGEIKHPILVVRYPHLACNTCMDSLLHYIPEIIGKNCIDNVCLIVDNSNEQYMHQFKRLKGSIFKNIISVENGEIILPYDQNKKPYIFLLNIEKKSDRVFIPIREKTDETKSYLYLVKKILKS